MPYRGHEPTGPACYRHAAAGAASSCARCLRDICEICVLYEGTLPHCPPCARRAQGIRRAWRIAGSVAATVATSLFAVAAGWIITRAAPYDYGAHAAEIHRLLAELDVQPCDHQRTVELAGLLIASGDAEGARLRARSYFARCEPEPLLLEVLDRAPSPNAAGDRACFSHLRPYWR